MGGKLEDALNRRVTLEAKSEILRLVLTLPDLADFRTLMDAVYDWSRFNSLPRGFSWIRQAVEDDSGIPSELAETTIKYGNQATIRRIGYLLETLSEPSSLLDLFQQHLTASKSLIPWIPGKPARGTVNRTWGVIVNE